MTIKNNGNAALNVSGISFNAPADPSFLLEPGLGTKPCTSVSPTLVAGDSCTVQVSFKPSANGSFTSTLRITSNDPTSPSFLLPIQGARENVTSLLVRINQLDTGGCANNSVKAYVSVTDQGGFPVLNLTPSNFSVTQTPTVLPLLTATYVDANTPIAISGALDHSGSVTSVPVAFADMKTGFSNFFGSLRAGDAGEIIKFNGSVQTVQPFTMDKLQLQAAIAAPYPAAPGTKLYDAVYQAIDETATPQTNQPRKAVIVATDGVDEGLPANTPGSTHTVDQVIKNGVDKKVPVFTIGLGASINATVLQQIASGTGGLYYQSSTSQNLATIYQQLSSLLYANQYVLTFNQLSKGNAGVISDIVIGANLGGVPPGSDTRKITSCN